MSVSTGYQKSSVGLGPGSGSETTGLTGTAMTQFAGALAALSLRGPVSGETISDPRYLILQREVSHWILLKLWVVLNSVERATGHFGQSGVGWCSATCLLL
jgi:hypothetical protein